MRLQNTLFMKKFISLLALAFALVSCGTTRSVGYAPKLFSQDDCSVDFSVLTEGSDLFIVVALSSEEITYSQNPVMKLRTFDGDVLELPGTGVNAHPSDDHAVIDGKPITTHQLKSIAQFQITEDQVELLKSGIKKIRLSTVPIVHEKTFRRDEIGKWLYRQLRQANDF